MHLDIVAIREIRVDDAGRLLVLPAVSSFNDFEHVNRAGRDVHWDTQLHALHSPELKADGWTYADWFRQILLAVASEYRISLQLRPETIWSIPADARTPIERRFDEFQRETAPAPRDELGAVRTDIGVVRWWRSNKGYGAISVSSTAPWDVWFHYSRIEGEGYRSLEPGERVEVTFMRRPRDTFEYEAIRVRKV